MALKMVYYKTVLMPIQVTASDYCWDRERICGYFDSEGGHPRCNLDLGLLRFNEQGYVPKPEKCLKLQEK
jgi:hypothetical protein